MVPCRELPANVRNLIKPPPRLAATTTDSDVTTTTVPPQTSTTTSSSSSTLPACPVTSPQSARDAAAESDSRLSTQTSSKCLYCLQNRLHSTHSVCPRDFQSLPLSRSRKTKFLLWLENVLRCLNELFESRDILCFMT